jgi:N6-L-threonylcarbamoyladenine synthase
MKILAIETSCDETSAAVVENGRNVLSNIVASQIEEHKLYGGVVPEIASRLHCESIVGVCESALEAAKIELNGIDAVAVTYAPGLIGALLVGVNFAKGLALAINKPLIPVHHIRGHVASNYITHPDLKPPFLALIVSGGHTTITRVNDYCDFEIIGTTLDDAAGEAFDKAARALGLPYPGGVYIDREAQNGDIHAYKLPFPKTEKPYDFSFSGLKTAVINLIHNTKQKVGYDDLGVPLNISDVAASFQHTACTILANKTLAAAEEFGESVICLAGGVAANSYLQKLFTDRTTAEGGIRAQVLCPELKYCGDNAAMIGSQAYYEYLSGNIADMSLNATATARIDRG